MSPQPDTIEVIGEGTYFFLPALAARFFSHSLTRAAHVASPDMITTTLITSNILQAYIS